MFSLIKLPSMRWSDTLPGQTLTSMWTKSQIKEKNPKKMLSKEILFFSPIFWPNLHTSNFMFSLIKLLNISLLLSIQFSSNTAVIKFWDLAVKLACHDVVESFLCHCRLQLIFRRACDLYSLLLTKVEGFTFNCRCNKSLWILNIFFSLL